MYFFYCVVLIVVITLLTLGAGYLANKLTLWKKRWGKAHSEEMAKIDSETAKQLNELGKKKDRAFVETQNLNWPPSEDMPEETEIDSEPKKERIRLK